MSSKQTCPHCNFKNTVFGIYLSGTGNGEKPKTPPVVRCGKCGKDFSAKVS